MLIWWSEKMKAPGMMLSFVIYMILSCNVAALYSLGMCWSVCVLSWVQRGTGILGAFGENMYTLAEYSWWSGAAGMQWVLRVRSGFGLGIAGWGQWELRYVHPFECVLLSGMLMSGRCCGNVWLKWCRLTSVCVYVWCTRLYAIVVGDIRVSREVAVSVINCLGSPFWGSIEFLYWFNWRECRRRHNFEVTIFSLQQTKWLVTLRMWSKIYILTI